MAVSENYPDLKANQNFTGLQQDVPEAKLLIETDCPYLSPEPNRGKRNDSRNIKYTAQRIADIRVNGIPFKYCCFYISFYTSYII